MIYISSRFDPVSLLGARCTRWEWWEGKRGAEWGWVSESEGARAREAESDWVVESGGREGLGGFVGTRRRRSPKLLFNLYYKTAQGLRRAVELDPDAPPGPAPNSSSIPCHLYYKTAQGLRRVVALPQEAPPIINSQMYYK